MIIKKINEDDVKNIEIENFDDFWNQEILNEEIKSKDSSGYIAIINEKVVGFIIIKTILDEIEIMNVSIHKLFRRKGIAKELLIKIIEYAKQNNIIKINLEVNEKNIAAISLYEKLNFKQVGLRKKYYNRKDSAILMTLSEI